MEDKLKRAKETQKLVKDAIYREVYPSEHRRALFFLKKIVYDYNYRAYIRRNLDKLCKNDIRILLWMHLQFEAIAASRLSDILGKKVATL